MVKKKLNNKRGEKVYVALTEYKKALIIDIVNREKLWETLQKLKTSSKVVKVYVFICPSMYKMGC